jgi:hypothetical protein
LARERNLVVLLARSTGPDPTHSSLYVANFCGDNGIIHRIILSTHDDSIGLTFLVKNSAKGAAANVKLALHPNKSGVDSFDNSTCLQKLLTGLAFLRNLLIAVDESYLEDVIVLEAVLVMSKDIGSCQIDGERHLLSDNASCGVTRRSCGHLQGLFFFNSIAACLFVFAVLALF